MTATDILRSDRGHDGVLRLTLNDVARRYALSEAMLNALGTTIAEVGQNPAVRAVILASNGSAFCACHNLTEMTVGRADADGGKSYFAKLHRRRFGVSPYEDRAILAA